MNFNAANYKSLLLCGLHTAFLHWPLSSAATKEVQGPNTAGRRIQGLLFLACWRCMDAICTLCPVSQKQVITGIEGWVSPPPPHQSNQDRVPSHPLSSTHSSPSQGASGGQPRRKHTSASGSRSEAMVLGKRRMWRPLWAFQQFSRRPDSWASDQRRLTSALPYSATF